MKLDAPATLPPIGPQHRRNGLARELVAALRRDEEAGVCCGMTGALRRITFRDAGPSAHDAAAAVRLGLLDADRAAVGFDDLAADVEVLRLFLRVARLGDRVGG